MSIWRNIGTAESIFCPRCQSLQSFRVSEGRDEDKQAAARAARIDCPVMFEARCEGFRNRRVSVTRCDYLLKNEVQLALAVARARHQRESAAAYYAESSV